MRNFLSKVELDVLQRIFDKAEVYLGVVRALYLLKIIADVLLKTDVFLK